jgi:hypothetical protein
MLKYSIWKGGTIFESPAFISFNENSDWAKLTFYLFLSHDIETTNADTLEVLFLYFVQRQTPSKLFEHYSMDISLDDFKFDTVQATITQDSKTSRSLNVSPNPITNHSILKYHLDAYESISASVFDLTGRKVIQARFPLIATGCQMECIICGSKREVIF